MQVLSTKFHTAKKDHQCDWCYQKINAGQKYESSFVVDSGDTYTWKNHTHCSELADKLEMFKECYGEGLSGDDFQEHIHQKYYNLSGISKDSFNEKLKYVANHFDISI